MKARETMKAFALCALIGGCTGGTHRGPTLALTTPLKPLYHSVVLNCLTSVDNKATGKPISMSAGYGDAALQYVAWKANNMGTGLALDVTDSCVEIARAGLWQSDRWAVPYGLKEGIRKLALGRQQAGNPTPASIVVPVVSSADPTCTVDGLYDRSSDLVADYGSVTCWEQSVRVGLLLFAPDGTLLWKTSREQGYGSPKAANATPGMSSEVDAIFHELVVLFHGGRS
jgi:hypothetical protein